MTDKRQPGIYVVCRRHNRRVRRDGNRILHVRTGSGTPDVTCDSQSFEVTDLRWMDRDEAARVLIVVELANQAGKLPGLSHSQPAPS